MQGLFISFEGGDGAGKSTQIERLASALRYDGYAVVCTREPGGTELGTKIRSLLLDGDDVSARAEALLYAADRAHHVDTLIRPALEEGTIVLTDRYLDSSLAYQSAGRSLPVDEVRDLSLWATSSLLPHMTFLLDIPASLGAERVGEEKDRMELAGVDFHEKVCEGFRQLASVDRERWYVIDAARSIGDIAHDVYAQVKNYIEHHSFQLKRENA